VEGITSMNSRFSAVIDRAGFNVPAGGNRDVVVRFAPDSAGNQEGSLRIANNSAENPKVVKLSGNGIRLKDRAGIQWVFVKGGTFQMGSNNGEDDEKPVHQVTVSDFYMAKTEVTVAQYRVFCKATGRTMPEPPHWGWLDDHPIVYVSWNDCAAFCNWEGGRLPTEAEWEFAAIGGTQSNGFLYSGGESINEVAWYSENSGNKTHQVGTKSPNELGIFDMSGNVWEWCADWYGKNYYSNGLALNPKGPNSGWGRVLRGGFWFEKSRSCRCTKRFRLSPDSDPSVGLGFRPARTP
jgi:formylglycine-generating enzyme